MPVNPTRVNTRAAALVRVKGSAVIVRTVGRVQHVASTRMNARTTTVAAMEPLVLILKGAMCVHVPMAGRERDVIETLTIVDMTSANITGPALMGSTATAAFVKKDGEVKLAVWQSQQYPWSK